MECEITRKPGAEKHHIMSRKRWGESAEVPENIIYLNPDLHTLSGGSVHSMGRVSFAKKYGLERRFQEAKWAVLLESARSHGREFIR